MTIVAPPSSGHVGDEAALTKARVHGIRAGGNSSSSSSSSGNMGTTSGTTGTSYSAPLRKFSEISVEELPEVLAVAKDSLNPMPDLEAWMQIWEAVTEESKKRQRQRDEWDGKLAALSSNLASLRAAQPRASWRSPTAHSQQLAGYGHRTLELAKQISKLETAISRAETDVRECGVELERLEKGDVAGGPVSNGKCSGARHNCDDDDKHGGCSGEEQALGEKALGRHTLALTMFRQLGFQPLLPSAASDATAPTSISTLFARSDSKGKVTPFKVGDGPSTGTTSAATQSSNVGWSKMSNAERVHLVNAMWDAVD